ncbi:MAG: methyltransferase domain-containing protein, partial [Deltaproteobacteria bacterium]|nr:methyltransferase domain-containing protein [Deltaproteobacteria bacterium]
MWIENGWFYAAFAVLNTLKIKEFNLVIQKKRKKCISCGTELPDDIVMIGDQYPSAIFLSEKYPVPPDLHSSSLNVTRCTEKSCSLIQLSCEYDLQYVFDHYPYESGSTATMKQILKDVVDDAQKIVQLKSDDVVLDIGGNDGTLLDLISSPVKLRVNIDAAADVKQKVTKPNYHHIQARYKAEIYKNLGLPNPKLITSVAMFYHLNNPLEFCRNVAEIMDQDSVWVLQMTYVGTMLQDNIFDNIVHEHVAYYSLFSVESLLEQVGLFVAEARIVKSYGGSLRLFIVKSASKFPREYLRKEYPTVQNYENVHGTNTFEVLYAFNSRIQLLRDSLKEIIKHLAKECGPIWGFGASTKGNMILQFLGIESDQLPCILDNSPKKIGTKTTGSLVPIVEEATHLSKLPDYLLILPYYYTEAFVRI